MPPSLLTCHVYWVVCLSCDVFVHAGFQAGAINAIGQSNLLVNLTVFRSNNGSQVPSITNVHSNRSFGSADQAFDLKLLGVDKHCTLPACMHARCERLFWRVLRRDRLLPCAQGGGIGMQGGGQLRVVESLFLRNTAQNGGGIFVQKCDPELLCCLSRKLCNSCSMLYHQSHSSQGAYLGHN